MIPSSVSEHKHVACLPCPLSPEATRSRRLPPHTADRLRHPCEVRLAHGRTRGEAQAVAEERLGHRAAHDLAARKDRLQVHGLPEGARLDVRPLQRQADVLPRRAELGRVHCDAGEPARGASPRRFGHEGDAGQVAEKTAVDFINLPLALYPLRKYA